mgnify:CR=1 FL=1
MKIEQKTFKTYKELEDYFVKNILPKKNLSSKVIGKKILYWKRTRPKWGVPRVPGNLNA